MTEADNPIVISVPFHGDTITVIDAPSGEFVVVKPICERFGLAWQPQHRKLTTNPRWGVTNMVIPSPGGMQEMTCIPASKVFGWLANITVSRVKPELRERLALYQDEADAVLDRFFRRQRSEQDQVIKELRSQLYHSHLHLMARNPKWAAILPLWRDGHMNSKEMAEMLQSRATHVDQARQYMENCGMIGAGWAADPQRPESMLDRIRDLEWKLEMASGSRVAVSAPAGQSDMFGED